MTAKELERLIADRGGNASALDTVTRKLREATRLSSGGRGFNAPALSASEAAWILIAYAASEVAARAAETVIHVSDFYRPNYIEVPGGILSNSLNAAVQEMLQLPQLLTSVESVRFARNLDLATIQLKDGRRISYCHEDENLTDVENRYAESFVSEGVLSAGLLRAVATGLAR